MTVAKQWISIIVCGMAIALVITVKFTSGNILFPLLKEILSSIFQK